MSLFAQFKKEMILSAANRSQQTPVEPPKKRQNAQSIKAELDKISAEVEEYFKDSPAQLITTRSQLHDYISDMIDAGIGGIDTETTGLDRLNDTIVGSSLYFPGGTEVYIPNRHKVPIFETYYPDQLDYREVQEEFDRLRQKNVKLVYANADFDLAMIYKDYKVDFIDNAFYDVIIAWRCMKENEKDNALKVLYNKYVLKGKGHAMKFRDFFSPELFPYSNPKIAKLYAANDAKITYELMKWQIPLITKDHPRCKKHKFEAMSELVWNVEFPMMKVCQNMHRRGVYLEPSYAEMLRRKYIPKQEKAVREVQDMVQELMNDPKYHTNVKPPFASIREFNPNSTVHKKWLCYDLLKLDGGKDKGTGKEILSLFNLPVTNKILECTSLSTLIGTFVEKLPNIVSKENRIHCQFKQIGADCITADSIIPTKSGYYTMGELCTSAKGTNGIHIDVPPVPILNCNQEYEDAVSIIRYENCPTIKITTEYGFSIEGTYNHPIMVSQYNKSDISKYRINKLLPTFWNNRNYKELSDIKIGDIVEIPCNYHTEGTYQRTNIVLAKSRKSCSTTIVPEIYTEEFAEFLGMYHADGDARFREGTYSVRISNCDSDVINRVYELCKKLFNVEAKTYTASNRINETTTGFSNIELSCLENILTHTAVNKRIPKAIWCSPTSVINSYIRGMTLDSSVYVDSNNSNRIKFELNFANMEDCKLVQMHLVSLGILSSIVNHSHHSYGVTPRLKFNSDNYIRFRDIIGFISKAKYRESESNGKNSYDRIRVQNSFRATVIKIEYKYNDVYDFHVPATHSFISNGIISHNTGRMSSASPNMQNIPSHHGDIRRMFRATPGYVIMSSDYSLHMLAVVKPC